MKALVRAAQGAAPDLVAELGLPKGAAKLGALGDPDFVAVHRLASATKKAGRPSHFAPVLALAENGQAVTEALDHAMERLARHKALEDEAKTLKSELRAAEKKREDLVAAARAKITPEAARSQILTRFRNTLYHTYLAYLDADRRAVTAAIENLHDKYAVTVRDIEKKRSDAVAGLDGLFEGSGVCLNPYRLACKYLLRQIARWRYLRRGRISNLWIERHIWKSFHKPFFGPRRHHTTQRIALQSTLGRGAILGF